MFCPYFRGPEDVAPAVLKLARANLSDFRAAGVLPLYGSRVRYRKGQFRRNEYRTAREVVEGERAGDRRWDIDCGTLVAWALAEAWYHGYEAEPRVTPIAHDSSHVTLLIRVGGAWQEIDVSRALGMR